MVVYKIKHKPTGLYYCPSSGRYIQNKTYGKYIKTNLSKKGKIYHSRPSLKWIGDIVYDHTLATIDSSHGYFTIDQPCRPFKEDEWEIEEL